MFEATGSITKVFIIEFDFILGLIRIEKDIKVFDSFISSTLCGHTAPIAQPLDPQSLRRLPAQLFQSVQEPCRVSGCRLLICPKVPFLS